MSERGRVHRGQTGDAHPAWRGRKVSVDAGRTRAKRMYPDGRPCERCGVPFTGGHSVERHHRDGDTINNEPMNIAWLCPTHHAEIHRMRDAQERRADRSHLPSNPVPPRAVENDDLEDRAEVSYRGVLRTEVCVCGGVIVAGDNPGMIRAAVEWHNATPTHEEWRAVNALKRPARHRCPCHQETA